ncbi:MAG TPA: Ig-like domain-containing protein [Longimicrobiaceae bacterium]|nr:Ig-like domain-containing protein [Longimicrobiaceae bacterium]
MHRKPTLTGMASLAGSALALLAACASPGEPEPAGAPVAIVSADTIRAGEVAAPLADSLIVKVTDAKGRGVPRQSVEWIAPFGGGEVSPVQAVTDDRGFARTAWTLGRSAGTQVAVARTVTTEGPQTVRFTAVASPGPLAALQISGQTLVAVEQERQLTVTRRDAYGNAITARPVAWRSSDTTVARVEAATGRVRGVAPGSAQVTVASEGRELGMTLTVVMAASFTAFDTVRAGTVGAAVAEPLLVRLTDARGRGVARQPVAWSSATAGGALAAVDGLTDDQGYARATLILGRTSGSYYATARATTGNGIVMVQFRAVAAPGPVSVVAVSPASVLLGAGQTRQLAATATDAYGNRVAGAAAAWSSSSAAVATIDPQVGLVRAVGPGSATITATIQGKTGTAAVVVDPLILLEDDFDSENGGRWADNYTGFAKWEVVAGSVDLVGTGLYDDFLPPENGVGVDLDGTTKQAGTLRSRTAFVLEPGEYQLSFQLAGSPRPSDPNTVVVSLGDAYRESFTLAQFEPLRTITRTVTVPARTTARLEFAHLGGDNYGILLDNVKLFRKP